MEAVPLRKFNKFEKTSHIHQLYKNGHKALPVMKCKYCRTEFRECFERSSPVCKKCDDYVKLYGLPSVCQYCNIEAAFLGTKCRSCTNSEKKYGPPVTCELCKQRCAFDRKGDSREKVDGQLLCRLCTLSYKRGLIKAKRNSSSRHSSSVSLSKATPHHSQNHKRPHSHSDNPKISERDTVDKKARMELAKTLNGTLLSRSSSTTSSTIPLLDEVCPKPSQSTFANDSMLDPSNAEYVVALVQLKDQVSSLKKQLLLKDQQLLAKHKQLSTLKAESGVKERELRLQIQAMNKSHSNIVDDLQSQNRVLRKQVVSLTKLTKKSANSP